MMQPLRYILLYWILSVSTFGTSIAMPDWNTFGRTSPLILVAKIEQPIRYSVIDEHNFASITPFIVVEVKKNILTDFQIEPNQVIKVHHVHNDRMDFGSIPTDQAVNIRNSKGLPEYIKGKDLIIFITLNSEGKWCYAPPRLTIHAERRMEEMMNVSAFKPVGIDRIEAQYTIQEWQDIADQKISPHYYQTDFASPRPQNWPNNFDEAVELTVDSMLKKGRFPLIHTTFHDELFNRMGLDIRGHRSSTLNFNKQLLKSMGRIAPHEARILIADKSEQVIHSRHTFPPILEELSQKKIPSITYKASSLQEAVENIFQQSHLKQPYKIVFKPNTVGLKVNIQLRNLEASRCLQFILQQTNSAIDVSLNSADGHTLTVYCEVY